METPARYRPEAGAGDDVAYRRIVETLEEHHASPAQSPEAEPRGALSPSPNKAAPQRAEAAAYRVKPVAPMWRFVGDILSYVVLLYLFLVVGQLLGEESIATCNYSPYQRGMNPDALGVAPISAPVRRFVFVYGVRLVQVIYGGILLALLPQLRRSLFLSFGLILGMYFVGEGVTELLKHHSGDMNCHTKHPNGVSGHYFFIMYNFWIIIYLGKVLRRSVTYSPYLPLIRLLSLFIALCCFGLEGFFSYYYGYHSIKQIIYGSLVGMVFAAASVSSSEYALVNNYGRYLKQD